jgi:uncharacterized phage protein (TIGR01671 family)
MREIKFRAWDITNKKMVYEANDLRDGYLIKIDLDGYIDATYKQICLDSDDIILMQYTGLTDKNGKEIYEGDIVSVYGNEEGDADTMIVSWNDKELIYELLNHNGTKQNLYLYEVLDDDNNKTIIIGNIYENPELLK